MGENLRMKLTRLDGSRCAWCGDIFYESDEECANREMKLCASCGRRVKSETNHKNREGTLVIIFLILAEIASLIGLAALDVVLGTNLLHYLGKFSSVFPMFAAIYFIVNRGKTPVWRAHEVYQEETIGKADVTWYSVNKGGVGFARLRILDNMIFPVCFLDKKGTPVSQTLCVRLHKSWCLFWKKAQVMLINDDLWKVDNDGKTPWEKAEKFVIFNQGKIIGEGILRSARTNDRQVVE